MNRIILTDEVIAAFLEGCATPAEAAAVIDAAKRDKRLREYLTIAAPQTSVLPMLAQAATGEHDNLCNIRCEQYVLQRFGITVSEQKLADKASSSDWLKEGGTPLFQIGNLCAAFGLSVARKYNASLEDIKSAKDDGYEIIVAVDGGEIDGDLDAEEYEDAVIGKIPDHSMVVLSIDNDSIVCFNPVRSDYPQIIPIDRFIAAWDDSNYYFVKINTKADVAMTYKPAPIDISDIALPESLTELTEAIAENTHEVWSQNRLKEGWSYGPSRDDANLKHPDLLPYSDLTESEKEYDRATAMNALKLIVKLGYRIEKE